MNAICEQTNKDDVIGCEKDRDQNNHGGRAHNKADSLNPFLAKITEKGTVFSFTNVAGTESKKNYEVTDSSIRYEFRINDSAERRTTKAMRRKYTIKFKTVGETSGYQDEFAYANDSGELTGRINQINLKEANVIPGEDIISTTNPAIWETEPKEDVGLDIYYEASNAIPVKLTSENTPRFAPYGSTVGVRQWNNVTPGYVDVRPSDGDWLPNVKNVHVGYIGYTKNHSVVGLKVQKSYSSNPLDDTDIDNMEVGELGYLNFLISVKIFFLKEKLL